MPWNIDFDGCVAKDTANQPCSTAETGQIRVTTGEEMSVPVAADDVVTFAANLQTMFPGRPVVLKADDNVPYRNVDKIIDSLKQAKIETIYLLSEQETVDDVAGSAGG